MKTKILLPSIHAIALFAMPVYTIILIWTKTEHSFKMTMSCLVILLFFEVFIDLKGIREELKKYLEQEKLKNKDK